MSEPWQLISRAAALALFLGAATTSLAQTPAASPGELLDEEVHELRRYSVEVIVFEYAGSEASENETFEPEPLDISDMDATFGDEPKVDAAGNAVIEFGDFIDRPVPSDGIDIDSELIELPSLQNIHFRRLQPDEMTMGPIYNKLTKLDAYRPVLWAGWSQSGLDESLTRAIRLRILGTPPLYFDGELSLYLKNYLHLVVNVSMQQPGSGISETYLQDNNRLDAAAHSGNNSELRAGMPPIIYRIQEDRIFRSGELRYYDHPKFGVLARINRIDGAEDEFFGDELLEPLDPGPN